MCSICLDAIQRPLSQKQKSSRLSEGKTANERIYEYNFSKLKCGHIFHKTCIDKWFNYAKKCPNCRTET